jgi:hypothetical protein
MIYPTIKSARNVGSCPLIATKTTARVLHLVAAVSADGERYRVAIGAERHLLPACKPTSL